MICWSTSLLLFLFLYLGSYGSHSIQWYLYRFSKNLLSSSVSHAMSFSTFHMSVKSLLKWWLTTGPWLHKLTSQSDASRGQLWPLRQATWRKKTLQCTLAVKRLLEGLAKSPKVLLQATLCYVKNGLKEQICTQCSLNFDFIEPYLFTVVLLIRSLYVHFFLWMSLTTLYFIRCFISAHVPLLTCQLNLPLDISVSLSFFMTV